MKKSILIGIAGHICTAYTIGSGDTGYYRPSRPN